MTISSDRIGSSVGEVLQLILAEESGEVLAVGFSEDATRELIQILAESEESLQVCLLVGDDILKRLRDDFILASTAVELVEAETLELRTSECLGGTLMVTEEEVISLLKMDSGHSAAQVTNDEDFVAAVRESWNGFWDAGESCDLRTPAYSQVMETLDEKFDSEMASDFLTVLQSAESMDDGKLDEIAVSLLVAAKHRKQLYDISSWGRDTGVASKGTFSRIKNLLEEQGLLDTERVPTNIGRPRLRLILGNERLHEANTDELADVARELRVAASV